MAKSISEQLDALAYQAMNIENEAMELLHALDGRCNADALFYVRGKLSTSVALLRARNMAREWEREQETLDQCTEQEVARVQVQAVPDGATGQQ